MGRLDPCRAGVTRLYLDSGVRRVLETSLCPALKLMMIKNSFEDVDREHPASSPRHEAIRDEFEYTFPRQ